MNPFDLSGPSFLAFYIGVAIIVVVVAKLAIDAAEGGAPPALPLGDPYQIAWLRGGTPEAARIAVLALSAARHRLDLDRYRVRPGRYNVRFLIILTVIGV
jgi:uncharacterized protein (TIGR04222 family)